MALYQQSTLPFSSAQSYVAAAGGSEGDTTMEILAGRAVSASLERYANFWRWEHYFTVFSGYVSTAGSVLGPFSGTVQAAASGQSSLTVNGFGSGYLQPVSARPPNAPGGYGFLLNIGTALLDQTWISYNDSNGLLILGGTLPIDVADGTAIQFKQQGLVMPTDVRDIYDVRLLKSGRVLIQMDQRQYDIARFQNTVGTTTHYGVWAARNNVSAAINLLPPPIENDQLMVRYYRRPVAPSAAGTVLDIPQDAELAVLSMAKAFYLADRGGNDARMQQWRQEGELALRELRARENQKPDEFPGLRPGYQAPGMRIGPNETWPYLQEG